MILPLGSVILVRIEFHQTSGGKIRPAVVLLDAGDDDFVAAPVTSQPRHSEFDLPIREWRTAGLNVPSYVRAHKLTVLPKSGIVRHLGALSETDLGALLQILARAFRLPTV